MENPKSSGNNGNAKNTGGNNGSSNPRTGGGQPAKGKPNRPQKNSNNPRTGGGKPAKGKPNRPQKNSNNPRTGGGKPARIDSASSGPLRPPKKGMDGIAKNLPAGDNSEDNALHQKGEQTQAAGRAMYDAGNKLEKVADKSKNAKTAAKAAKASNVAKKASSKASTAGTVVNVAGDAVNAGKKMKQGDVAGATDDVIRGGTTATAEVLFPTIGGTAARTILDSAPGRFASRNLAKIGVGAAGIIATSVLMIVVIVIALISTLLTTISIGAASACADGGSSNSSPAGGDVSDPGTRTAAKYFWDELKKAGYSEYSAAGIIGNLYQESRFNPREDNGSHVGIAQWSNGADGNRWGELQAYVATKKLDPYSIKGQIAFLIYEAANSYNMPELMKAVKSPEEAAGIWVRIYEGADGQQNAERNLFSKQWYDSLKNNRPFAGVGMITGFTSNIISLVAPSIVRTVPASKKIYWPISPWPGSRNGHDISVPVGTPVYAVTDGTVVESMDLVGNEPRIPVQNGYYSYGRIVKIQHNGVSGLFNYAHLSERKVKKGDKVVAGQLIGLSGNTGHSFGPHLHIDINGANGSAMSWLQEHNPTDVPAGGVAGGGGGDVAPPVKPAIVDKMMKNATKPLYKENIKKYAMRHYGKNTFTLTPKAVVLHYTGGPGGTGLGNLSVWDQDSSGAANSNGEPSPPPAAHFIIEQDGTIYQVMPTNLIVRHTLGVNDVALGIEFVDVGPATNVLARQKQLDSGLALVRWLMYENKIPLTNILGHGTANESPLFHDKIMKNDHTDWTAPEVEKFKSLIGEIGTGSSGAEECEGDSGGAGSGSAQNEESPRDCPATAPPGTINVAGDPKKLCEDAVRNAATPEAARAIKYAFKNLGAPYSQQNRTGSNPNVYDCSSFVARAYDAAGAKIKRGGAELGPWLSVFGYTGAYMPSIYDGTNLQRVMKKEDMRPGDIIIQFAGADPGNSAGNAGHAQIYLGNDIVIESTSPVSDVRAYGQWAGDNMWYFRYNSAK